MSPFCNKKCGQREVSPDRITSPVFGPDMLFPTSRKTITRQYQSMTLEERLREYKTAHPATYKRLSECFEGKELLCELAWWRGYYDRSDVPLPDALDYDPEVLARMRPGFVSARFT